MRTVSEVDQNLRRSLYDAIEKEDIERIKELVRDVANIEHRDIPMGIMPLIFAIGSNSYEAFKAIERTDLN